MSMLFYNNYRQRLQVLNFIISSFFSFVLRFGRKWLVSRDMTDMAKFYTNKFFSSRRSTRRWPVLISQIARR